MKIESRSPLTSSCVGAGPFSDFAIMVGIVRGGDTWWGILERATLYGIYATGSQRSEQSIFWF